MGEFIASLIALVILVCIGLWISSAECSSKWRGSGFKTSWGPIQGCLISKDGKAWIPSENYRDIP